MLHPSLPRSCQRIEFHVYVNLEKPKHCKKCAASNRPSASRPGLGLVGLQETNSLDKSSATRAHSKAPAQEYTYSLRVPLASTCGNDVEGGGHGHMEILQELLPAWSRPTLRLPDRSMMSTVTNTDRANCCVDVEI